MNISEIAKLAKVSTATVSRFLNNGYVSVEKKERIKKIIEETGYKPSSAAQTMRTNKNYLIGVIVPKLSSESIAKMVDGINRQLKGSQYNILLAGTNNDVDNELDYLKLFKDNVVDGVIFVATILNKKHHEIMLSYKKPIVILSQFDNKYPCVYFDDRAAAYEITNHLINQGCKKIVNIHVLEKDKAAGEERINGYKMALKDNNIKYNPEYSVKSDFVLESGYGAMNTIFERGIDFDAVFAATDTIAIGAMACITERGLRIPDDVKIASIGDSKMSAALNPTLTTAHFYYTTGGSEACKIMLELLETNAKVTKQYKVGYELCERNSSK